jgi:hypothetical protein
MHLTRQSGADVEYGDIRRKNNTLKFIIPPGTVTETTRQQPNGAVTSELTFKFSTAKVVVKVDPYSTCRPKLSAAHPLLTDPEDAELTRYPPPGGIVTTASMRSSSSCSLFKKSQIFATASYNCIIFSTCNNGQLAGSFMSPDCREHGRP